MQNKWNKSRGEKNGIIKIDFCLTHLLGKKAIVLEKNVNLEKHYELINIYK